MICMRGMFIAMAVVAMVSPAQAVVVRHDVDVANYKALWDNPLFQCVGLVRDSDGNYGSGTLIAQDWVLTAAHLKTATNQFVVNGTTYVADQFIRNPSWDGEWTHGHDLALLHLVAPLTSITPAAIYTGSSEQGKEAALIGYGGYGTGDVGVVKYNKVRHGAMNTIDVAGRQTLKTDFDNPNDPSDSQFGSSTPLFLEGTSAPGDSGGGLFLFNSDQSKAYLTGIISWYGWLDGEGDADYGDMAGYSRVSPNIDWISSVTGITVPEPSTLCLLGIGGAALLFWRRMRKT